MKVQVFLESDEFGREYFDAEYSILSFGRLCASSETCTRTDGITRRVGVEFVEDSDE